MIPAGITKTHIAEATQHIIRDGSSIAQKGPKLLPRDERRAFSSEVHDRAGPSGRYGRVACARTDSLEARSPMSFSGAAASPSPSATAAAASTTAASRRCTLSIGEEDAYDPL